MWEYSEVCSVTDKSFAITCMRIHRDFILTLLHDDMMHHFAC